MTDLTCSIDGCERQSRSNPNRYCAMHYERFRLKGDVGTVESKSERLARSFCSVDGCERRVRNLTAEHCRLHDYRWQKYGNTDKPEPHNKIKEKCCRECGYKGPDFYGYLNSICIPCYRAYQRAYDAKYKEKRGYGKTREWVLRKNYGMTIADYDAMLVAQGGGCAICGALPESVRFGTLAVDHCHTTGAVRGLLCHGCNRAIGFVNDSPDLLRRAADYLDESRRD